MPNLVTSAPCRKSIQLPSKNYDPLCMPSRCMQSEQVMECKVMGRKVMACWEGFVGQQNPKK